LGAFNGNGIAVFGGDLFITRTFNTFSEISEFNATTGALVNASFVTGLGTPMAMAMSGGDLFVADAGYYRIGEYNATTGAAVNASLISSLNYPVDVAVLGGGLFVADYGTIVVPEPSTLALAALGFLALVAWRLRRR
jgi:hypothetical protein